MELKELISKLLLERNGCEFTLFSKLNRFDFEIVKNQGFHVGNRAFGSFMVYARSPLFSSFVIAQIWVLV